MTAHSDLPEVAHVSARTIYRYPLAISDLQRVSMPGGATLLHVAPSRTEPDGLDLWAAVDTIEPEEQRTVLMVGTGHPLPADVGRHVGSCITHGGAFVWHVFEQVAAEAGEVSR